MSRHLSASDLRSVCLCTGCHCWKYEEMVDLEIFSSSSDPFMTSSAARATHWMFLQSPTATMLCHAITSWYVFTYNATGSPFMSCRSKCDSPANGRWIGTGRRWCSIDSWSEQITFYSPSADERMAISTICRNVELNIKKNMLELNKKKKELNCMYVYEEREIIKVKQEILWLFKK